MTTLFQMVNVPSGVWIDEEGNIVRPSETAYSSGGKFMGQQLGDKRYAQGVRDWVKNGKKSKWVMSKEKLKEKLALQSPEKQKAEAHFRLGVYLHKNGNKDGAKAQWAQSQKLHPDNWNYHRQAWLYEGMGGQMKWMQKVHKLNGKPYYLPLDAPKEGEEKGKERPKSGERKDF
jgi:hypothetical protein